MGMTEDQNRQNHDYDASFPVLADSTGRVVQVVVEPPKLKRRARGPGLRTRAPDRADPQPTPPPQEELHRKAKRAHLPPSKFIVL